MSKKKNNYDKDLNWWLLECVKNVKQMLENHTNVGTSSIYIAQLGIKSISVAKEKIYG